MPTKIADTAADLVDALVPMNQPLQWEFLGFDPGAFTPSRYEILGGALVQDFHMTDFPEIVGATQRLIEHARDVKCPPGEVVVLGLNEPYPAPAPEDPDLAGIVLLGDLPITADLHARHREGDPKYVRLDTRETYLGFRSAHSQEMAAVATKVAELDAILRAHMADGHGGQQLVGEYLDDISRLGAAASPERTRIPLSLPPELEDVWDCWREGDTVCCALGLPGHDGEIRICTSATPISRHVHDVIGYAHAIGCDVPSMLGVLPEFACRVAGGSLLPIMAAAAPSLLARPEAQDNVPFVGRIVSGDGAATATLSALDRQARAGDRHAAREWEALASIAQKHKPLARALKKVRR